jgi:hypothetical protein
LPALNEGCLEGAQGDRTGVRAIGDHDAD